MDAVSRDCPVCGRTYLADPGRLRHGRQTACSRPCSYRLRSVGLSKAVEMTCAACGKAVRRKPSQLKDVRHKSVYCSSDCHYAGRRLGITPRVVAKPYTVRSYDRTESARKTWESRRRNGTDRHTAATRERLREATAKHIAGKAKGVHVSKLEGRVADELRRVGVPFEPQYGVRDPQTGRYAACVDFFLAGRVALEVNGTFWHSDPRHYPDGPVFPAQRRMAESYARKLTHLAAVGIPLVELWEADAKLDMRHAVAQVLKAAGLG